MRRLLPIACLACACATPTTYRVPARGAAGASARPWSSGSSTAPVTVSADAQRGVASYYADSLEGNSTANGERYDPGALTAAHRTLRFGTRVRVERDNGAAVEVCINDRGPYVDGRVIDLSRAAAETIGMIRAGIAEVTVRVVGHSGSRRCE